MRKLLILIPLFLVSELLWAQSSMFKVGDTLPDFAYQGQFSKPYRLHDLKGSYVLINFWASWNEDSRELQLDLIDPYVKYKDRKFKKGRKFYIISVSLDENRQLWEVALKKDNLPWKNHVFDKNGWKSATISRLKVQYIPCNYLIDPDGRIVAVNIDATELDELLKNH